MYHAFSFEFQNRVSWFRYSTSTSNRYQKLINFSHSNVSNFYDETMIFPLLSEFDLFPVRVTIAFLPPRNCPPFVVVVVASTSFSFFPAHFYSPFSFTRPQSSIFILFLIPTDVFPKIPFSLNHTHTHTAISLSLSFSFILWCTLV